MKIFCRSRRVLSTKTKGLILQKLLKNYYPPRDLRSSKKNLLVVPAFRTNSYGRRAFSVIARFSGTVFLNVLGMLDHLTFLKDSLKLLFLYTLFRFMK